MRIDLRSLEVTKDTRAEREREKEKGERARESESEGRKEGESERENHIAHLIIAIAMAARSQILTLREDQLLHLINSSLVHLSFLR